jgi:hypothetical protein
VAADEQDVYALSRGAAHFGCTNTRFTDSATQTNAHFADRICLKCCFSTPRNATIGLRIDSKASAPGEYSVSTKSDSEMLNGLKGEMLNPLRM